MRWLAVLALGLSLGGTAGPAQERLAVTRADGAKVAILDFRPEGADCPPLLILSHGAGGTEQALAWLARDAMHAGFRAITMAHAESGRAQLRKVLRSPDRRAALVALVTDRQANAARMRDLDAVWSYATRACRPGFAALAGHSMGAQTAMIEAGAKSTLGVTGKNRFDAYAALSPQGEGSRFRRGAWAGIGKPVLMVTGTRDAGLDGGLENRVTAFEGLSAGHKWLAVIEGATHMNIGGFGRPRMQRDVSAIVLAFLTRFGKPFAKDMPALRGVQYRMK